MKEQQIKELKMALRRARRMKSLCETTVNAIKSNPDADWEKMSLLDKAEKGIEACEKAIPVLLQQLQELEGTLDPKAFSDWLDGVPTFEGTERHRKA
jgi:hypothetical protein